MHSSRRPCMLGLVVAVGTIVASWPTRVDACTCFAHVDVAWPPREDPFPANAPLVLRSFCGGDPNDIVVTADGASLQLVEIAADPAVTGRDRTIFALSPPPRPGAELVVSECSPPDAECVRTEVTLAVTEADTVAPNAPAVAVDVAPGTRRVAGCGEPGREVDVVRWTVGLTPDPAEDDVVASTLALATPDGAVLAASEILELGPDAGPVEETLSIDRGAVPGEVCVRASSSSACPR